MSVLCYVISSVGWGALGYFAAVINYRLSEIRKRMDGHHDGST